jgi:hypothetical protein
MLLTRSRHNDVVWNFHLTPYIFSNLFVCLRNGIYRHPMLVHLPDPWSLTKSDAAYNRAMNEACVADTCLSMDIMLKDTSGGASSVFGGGRLTSLVDVGGGHGAAAIAIANAFPHIKCTVLDLKQVIDNKVPPAATVGTDRIINSTAATAVQFVVGDMFESIPPADAVLLRVSTYISMHVLYIPH